MKQMMRIGVPPDRAPKSHWKAILTVRVDQALDGTGFEREGPITWTEPPWEHYLNGTSGPPGYLEVSFEAVRRA